MPIPLPNLDDRGFDDLVAEAKSLIPGLTDEWTDHNASDPGIAIVELLAWLTEMLLYQINEIPPAHTARFLTLLRGPDYAPPKTAEALAAAVGETVSLLREPHRAVTAADYDFLVRNAHRLAAARQDRDLLAAKDIRRVEVVPRRDLATAEPADRELDAPAHLSVVVVCGPDTDGWPQPTTPAVLEALTRFLGPRRVLTVHHHVVEPTYVDVPIEVTFALRQDVLPAAAFTAVAAALRRHLHPLRGGANATGWPFGRAVHPSDVYAVLDRIELVDFVAEVSPRPAAVPGPRDLVQLGALTLRAYDAVGDVHVPPDGTVL